MCGICGFAISSRASVHPGRAVLERMRDVLHHRGPDDAGLFLEPGVGLGHRRLSIVDVAGGHQPMASDDGRLQLVYNGEVYNHAELRPGLEQRGHRYHTRCDTETVLHLYEEEGDRTPTFLRGMFAIAIWDRTRRELFLARDRFGVKPLYYALTDDGSIYFASEIKGILASGAVAPRLDPAALPEYLANHATFGDDTLFAGIRRLPPGHTLRWRDGEVKITRYWDLSFEPGDARRSEADLVAEYDARLRDAVRMRLMADVPLGAFLSGGIDSAAITAIMAQLVREPVKTFSVAFAEREANELQYARMVAERFRTEHHEIVVSPSQFFEAVPSMVWHEDEPIAHPSSVPLYFVSKLAQEHVKVVLTGEGSDETLAGYNRYRATVFNLRFGRGWERATPDALRTLVRRTIESLPRRSRLRQKLSRTFLALPADLDTIYFDNFSVFSRAWQSRLLGAELRRSGEAPYRSIARYQEAADAPTLLGQLLYVDTKTYLHELLMKQDQMSMAASIESRVPFLDHPLVEFAAGMPDRMKLRGWTTKHVLRQAMANVLPAPILSRKKMGFPVPVGAWLRGPYRAVLDEFVLGERALGRGLFEPAVVRELVHRHVHGGENHAERLWSLVNLEVWQRMFVDGEPREQIRLGVERSPSYPAVSPALASSATSALRSANAH